MKINILIITLMFSISNFSQKKYTKSQLDSLPNTIENQFIKTYESAKRWNQYKMIDKQNLYALKKTILDSVNIIKKNVVTKQSTINEQQTTITNLNTQIEELNTNLKVYKDAEKSKNNIKGILYGIIAALALGLTFFLFKFKNSNSLTKIAKKNLIDVEEEFEEHRKKSIEREQKLRRQLQDEINKQRGI